MKTPLIVDYQIGRMVVDNIVHTHDLIILPDTVKSNWWRKEGHRLDVADLEVIFEAHPQMLIIGAGAYGMMKVPEETRKAIQSADIQLEIAPTGEAWQVFNSMREIRLTAGAFHLTC